MSSPRIVPFVGTYVVTDAGREAANREDRCFCKMRVDQGMLVCEYCGTAYRLTRPASFVQGAKRP
jgi:uncharacterized Zn-finger protein